jgi:ACS family allantoate permease-like MFS transporter
MPLKFSSLIIKGFDYGTLETLLLTMPQGACQVAVVIGASYLATKFRKSRSIIIACLLCISPIGWALVGSLPSQQRGAKLFGVFILSAYAATFLLSLSMVASDVAGYTKKTVVSSILFLAYFAGNIRPTGVLGTRGAAIPHRLQGLPHLLVFGNLDNHGSATVHGLEESAPRSCTSGLY